METQQTYILSGHYATGYICQATIIMTDLYEWKGEAVIKSKARGLVLERYRMAGRLVKNQYSISKMNEAKTSKAAPSQKRLPLAAKLSKWHLELLTHMQADNAL